MGPREELLTSRARLAQFPSISSPVVCFMPRSSARALRRNAEARDAEQKRRDNAVYDYRTKTLTAATFYLSMGSLLAANVLYAWYHQQRTEAVSWQRVLMEVISISVYFFVAPYMTLFFGSSILLAILTLVESVSRFVHDIKL
jgi:hypothetical protein